MVSVVASWSVALPLPSSPHWAPRITIAGIAASFGGPASASGGRAEPARVEALGTTEKQKAPATAHRGSCGHTIPQAHGTVATPTSPCCRPQTSDSVRPMEPLLVITNSDAGTADEESLDQALAVLREHVSVEVQATGDPGELDGVLHRAGSRRIVVAGGDGSLHAGVSALHRRHDLSRSTLALLPLGTGNDFARGTGISLDPAEAAEVALFGDVRPLDLLVDELGEVVVNNVHAGASAQASRRAARWKERLGGLGVGKVNLGKLGYPIGAALAAVKPPFVRLRVEVDGEVVAELDQHLLMISIGNSSH